MPGELEMAKSSSVEAMEFLVDLSENPDKLRQFKEGPEDFLGKTELSAEAKNTILGGMREDVAALTITISITIGTEV
jgi:hypothetical protein